MKNTISNFINLIKIDKNNNELKYKNSKKKNIEIIKIIFYKKLISFIYFILFLLSYFLYYKSLEKCFYGFDLCGQKAKWILIKLSEAIISYIILAILLELMILKRLSKYHLIHILIIYFFFYKYSHGLDFDDHGYFNFIGGISIISLIIFGFMPLNLLIFLYKKNKNYVFIYVIILIIIFSFYFNFADSYMNCREWAKGLNNTYIDNNIKKHGCYIKIPKICPYKIGKYVFDITKWQNLKCHKNKENTKEIILDFSESKYINQSTKRIGFPLVNKNSNLFKIFNEHNSSIKSYIKKYLVDMDNLLLIKKIYKNNNPEIIIDYTNNPYGEMIIDLKYNDTLSKERKKKRK